MANLHILREHSLGLPAARKIALAWAEQVESDFDMQCTYEESKTADAVAFSRSGVSGTLHVTSDRFELDAKLGFLLGAFKGRIEAEIVKNLDDLLAPKSAAKAGPKSAAKSAAKKAAAKK
ncbi:MAG: polyhydroxyalkanoic acid synthase [Burkholderiales bacterium PBB3]|nr:MAG: polyhydroxyalkanoic acid synthase [Burkholderiales bacterium PBB3]